jgi:hypothetical protein
MPARWRRVLRQDPSKVDRSAAYAARYVAKNVVAAGLARQCQVQVAYAIGVAQPMNITVYNEGTGVIPDEQISKLVAEHFDLRPRGIIQMLDLLRPIYEKTAAYGHFGRDEPEFSWERTIAPRCLPTQQGSKRRAGEANPGLVASEESDARLALCASDSLDQIAQPQPLMTGHLAAFILSPASRSVATAF